MRRMIFAVLLFVLAFPVVSAAQALTSNISVFNLWVPVIVLAVLLSVGITIVFYAIATLLGNASSRPRRSTNSPR